VVNWWVQSPGHRANILSDTYKELDVAVVAASAFKSLTSAAAASSVTTTSPLRADSRAAAMVRLGCVLKVVA
jgi:hypothetical protein